MPHSQWVGDVRTPDSWRAGLQLGGVQGGGEIMGVGGLLLCLKGGGRRAGEGLGSQGTGLSCEMGQQKVREDSTQSWEVRR